VNTWNKNTSNFGLWLNGKTISRICVAYDHAPETGNFRGYVDDISITQSKDSVYIFNGNGNWDVAANWFNNSIPPSILSGGYIFIDPVVNGECVLNVEQHVINKNNFIINANKKFRITGNLIQQ
jgi:hypothetical protein